jgi:cellobiose-specific phosphotransferase system component IIA
MAKLTETVLKLVDDVDAAKEKVKQANKDHAAAVKDLSAAQRLEKKTKEATLEAHKVQTELLHNLVEALTKELQEAPVDEVEPEKPVEPAPTPVPAPDTSGNTVVPKSEVEVPKPAPAPETPKQ